MKSKDNKLTYALSRLDFKKFRKHGKHMDKVPIDVPNRIWPIKKVWLDNERHAHGNTD